MFSLLVGVWQWWRTKEELKFLVVGLDNAGKTTTLEQIKRNFPSNTPQLESLNQITPTIGLNLAHIDYDRRTAAIFWDMGGQLMLRGIWESHYSACDGLVLVVDSCDCERLLELRKVLAGIMSHPALSRSARFRAVPVCILLNKQDVQSHAGSIEKLVAELDLATYYASLPRVITYDGGESNEKGAGAVLVEKMEDRATDLTCPEIVCVCACSARTGRNIGAAISVLVETAKLFARKQSAVSGPL